MKYFIYITASLLLILSSCTVKHDDRLAELNRRLDSNPEGALEELDSLRANENFSKADGHLLDLLTIKAKDKAFITHTSDTAIRTLIDYYSKHETNDFYAEALYYGGRVNSDIGDYPTALDYFQQALDITENDKELIKLRGCIVSQMGSILDDLRLYSQALPYAYEALRIDSILDDTLNMIYDLHLLGSINSRNKNLDKADSCYHCALNLAYLSKPELINPTTLFLSDIELRKHNFDSARCLFRSINGNLPKYYWNYYLCCGADIYRHNGMPDSSFMYASELVRSNIKDNKKSGYKILLSQQLRAFIPEDSIRSGFSAYVALLEEYFDESAIHHSIIQDTQYNYQRHLKARIEAESQKTVLLRWIIIFIVLAALCAVISLYLFWKNKTKRLRINHLLQTLELLSKEHNLQDNNNTPSSSCSKTDESRIRLKGQINSLLESGSDNNDSRILLSQSETVKAFKNRIEANQSISESNPLWDDLHDAVTEVSPQFKYKLLLLSDGALTTEAHHLALLIKCGFNATQCSKILGKTKATTSYRRKVLCSLISDGSFTLSDIDRVIRSL